MQCWIHWFAFITKYICLHLIVLSMFTVRAHIVLRLEVAAKTVCQNVPLLLQKEVRVKIHRRNHEQVIVWPLNITILYSIFKLQRFKDEVSISYKAIYDITIMQPVIRRKLIFLFHWIIYTSLINNNKQCAMYFRNSWEFLYFILFLVLSWKIGTKFGRCIRFYQYSMAFFYFI